MFTQGDRLCTSGTGVDQERYQGINFVQADVNCDLRVFTSRGNHKEFESIVDLENIISNL